MARKFLYLVLAGILIYLGGRLALQFYPGALSRVAFVPKTRFEPQPPLAADVYADRRMWLSYPGKPDDPARFQPAGAPAPAPLDAAVFFIHPTSYLAKDHWNAPLDDADSQARAKVFLRGLASPFAGAPLLYAPRYRQAALGAFLTDEPAAKFALDLAYADVRLAFRRFLAEVPADKPIVLVGHSQGALHLLRLLREDVAGKPVARRVAAAYAIGWPISPEHDLPGLGLPACDRAGKPGCVASYLSFAEPADPVMIRDAWEAQSAPGGETYKGSGVLCFNPLTGGLGGSAPASANLGTLVPDTAMSSGTLMPGLVPATCRRDGLLSIGEPAAMGPFVLPGNNYHVYDIPLFWANLRADVTARVNAWKP
ncbi:DUF3089 domain-containing protein [Parablastomonas sp. CN1-191]|uniref:DUF3089 domain-containing protein n=1 Tax=Parablastomonas sp. CN1-191 TaxID=3400908 RepID=UPI003BF8A66C